MTQAFKAAFILSRSVQQFFCVGFLVLAFAWPVSAQDGEMPDEGKLTIEMQPFDFTMFKRGRTVGKVSISLTLVVNEQSESEMIRDRLPQIRSDFLAALTVLSRLRFDVNRPIDPDVVTVYLKPYLEHRIGPDKVSVYVRQALIKPA